MSKYVKSIKECAAAYTMSGYCKPCDIDKNINQFALCAVMRQNLVFSLLLGQTNDCLIMIETEFKRGLTGKE